MPADGLNAYAFYQSCYDSFFKTTPRTWSLSSALKKAGERQQFYPWAIKAGPGSSGTGLAAQPRIAIDLSSTAAVTVVGVLRRVALRAWQKSEAFQPPRATFLQPHSSRALPLAQASENIHAKVAVGNYFSLSANKIFNLNIH